ncbi:hypothetical protein [Vibrio hippocampi]|uniref:Porin n=1 Tax=Vibrio hippocampi TaxID=654686 RepID=A0ABN8DI25_9VIBR|nr:hypothetical protein [Vibrio hippocampi]CAH0525508.1 hypothetical protein VHP8226_01033 [Vibrio hippocampi]
MKFKLTALTALVLSTNTMADIYVDANYKSHDIGAVKVGSNFGLEGLDVNAEVSTVKGNYDKTELEAAYQFNITSNWYVTPSANYVFNKKMSGLIGSNYSIDDTYFIDNDGKEITGLGFTGSEEVEQFERTNVAKFSLKTGYNFDNGFYTAARFRHEMGGTKLISESTAYGAYIERIGNDSKKPVLTKLGTKSSSEELKTNRWDLTVGYDASEFAPIAAQYNYVHRDYSGVFTGQEKSHEMKLVYTGFESAAPYIEYTANESRDNELKAGFHYTF